MRIQVRSAPDTMSTDVGRRMVGVIFTDASDRTTPDSYFVPLDNVLKRMPLFEDCAEYLAPHGGHLPAEEDLRHRLTRDRKRGATCAAPAAPARHPMHRAT